MLYHLLFRSPITDLVWKVSQLNCIFCQTQRRFPSEGLGGKSLLIIPLYSRRENKIGTPDHRLVVSTPVVPPKI